MKKVLALLRNLLSPPARLLSTGVCVTAAWLYVKLLAPGGRVCWLVIAFVASLLSFGALDLNKKRINKGSIARVWSFFWPFLISREGLPIVVPSGIPLPVFNGWREGFTRTQKITLGGYALAALAFVTWGAEFDFHPLHEMIGEWSHGAVVVTAILLALSLLKSLPVPTFRRGALPLPATVRGVAVANRTLLVVPEYVRTWLLLALTGVGIYLVNHYAVQMNSLNGDFMDSITSKDAVRFEHVLREFGVVLAIFTVLGPVYSWIKQTLVLDFCRFATRFMMRLYTLNRNFYPLSLLGTPDNPNERIQQDVPAMCSASLGFLFIVIDSLITFYLFGGILWEAEKNLVYQIPLLGHTYAIAHLLLWVLIGYALLGSNGVVRVGWRLIKLQAEQKQLGADFRVGMVMFEKYAEPIAAYHGEEREYKHLWWRFMLSLKNNYAIIRWQRNLGFFTSGYDRVAALLPYAALAPFYFAGKILFGTISRAVGAFGEILSSASIFVSQFSALTNLVASIDRVGELRDALENLSSVEADGKSRIKIEDGPLLDIKGMTLFTPDRKKTIVQNFDFSMALNHSVAVVGPSGSGKTSILRAIVGLPMWDRGEGMIQVAARPQTLMLTQLAYLPSGATLREQILYPAAQNVEDAALSAVLKQVNLPDLCERVGGLDNYYNWDSLSGGERQRLVIARALINKVRLVIADEATSGLDADNEETLYRCMIDAGITLLSVTHKPNLIKFHERVVELAGDGKGSWRIVPASECKMFE